MLGKLSPWWNKYSKAQRRNIAIAVISGLVCAVVILWLVMRPNYETIMAGLDNKSLGQADQKLKELNIADKINGSSIEVPSSQADEARMQLAMAGVPSGTGYIGYGSIQNSLGMTKDQFNIQVLDALQQSLNQTIQSIDGIEGAQVHIVMPDEQLFVSQPDNSATASVFVQVGQGVQLSAVQVSGIQQLVAHSVKGLSPNNVTVVDQNGVSLSGTSDDPTQGGDVNGELRIRQKVEQDLQSQLFQGLSQIVGPGNSVVVVHANVSFDQVTSKSQTYQPVPGSTTGLPSSSQTDKKSSTSTTGGATGGIPGQAGSNPNLPSYSGSGTGAGGSSSNTETSQSYTYDNNQTVTTTTNDPMQTKGYTISVLLNAADKNLTSNVVQQIRDFVATAAGQSAAAGANNNITVATVPFHTPNLSGGISTQNFNWGLWGPVAGAVALIGGGYVLLRKRKQDREEDLTSVQPISELEPLLNGPLTDDERMKDELSKMADRRPDEFVSLLRSWLAGE